VLPQRVTVNCVIPFSITPLSILSRRSGLLTFLYFYLKTWFNWAWPVLNADSGSFNWTDNCPCLGKGCVRMTVITIAWHNHRDCVVHRSYSQLLGTRLLLLWKRFRKIKQFSIDALINCCRWTQRKLLDIPVWNASWMWRLRRDGTVWRLWGTSCLPQTPASREVQPDAVRTIPPHSTPTTDSNILSTVRSTGILLHFLKCANLSYGNVGSLMRNDYLTVICCGVWLY